MRKVILIISVSFLLIASFFACKVSHPARVVYDQRGTSRGISNWQELFAQTPMIDSFKVLHTGSVKVPLSGMLNVKKLSTNHGLSEFLWVEVYSYLFHHKKKGWYMIDSGLDESFQGEGNIKGLLASNYIKDSRQKVGQNIGSHLKRTQKDIEGIFFTHLHGDHTAGLPEIDRAIPKYCGKAEEFHQIPLLYHSNHLTAQDTLHEIDWESGVKMGPLDAVVDIFGDGSLFGIHTPGHSNGHLSYLLHTTEGNILLTGDASHTRYGFEHNIEPGWADDASTAANSLRQLREFASTYPNVKVIYGHER